MRTLTGAVHWEPINPGGTAAYGAVIFDGPRILWEDSAILEPEQLGLADTSNNCAEYAGFLAILRYCLLHSLHEQHIIVYGDSKLVIEQQFGTWRIQGGLYAPLARRARLLTPRFARLQGRWIPREENTLADRLSKQHLTARGVPFRLQPR